MRGSAPLLALAMAAVLSGCDQLPWSSKTDVDAGGPTTAQSGIAPVRAPILPSEVVAKVNDVSISRNDIELRLQELKALVESVGETWTPLSDEQLQDVSEELVNTELMAQDAVERGLDRSVDVQRRWEYLRRGFFAQEWLRRQQEQLNVSAEDVQAYYEQNQLGFREPGRIRLRQLVVGSEDQAKRALTQLHSGAVRFEDLAQQISMAPTAGQGGRLEPWIMRADDKVFLYGSDQDAEADGVISLDPALEAAAFAIDQVNNYSSYVKGADGRFHIFQLIERQDEIQQAISDVWDNIKTFLQAQKLQEALEQLKQSATIQRSPERLAGVSP